MSKYRIWRKYARTHNGAPLRCIPSREEVTSRGWSVHTGSDGKVIYNDRESAAAAAAEFEKLGRPAMDAYPCDRSKRGHYHLTTRPVE